MSVRNISSSSPWSAFTGLVPVILMVPILLAHWYAFGVLVAVVGCVGVVAYHLARRQGITSLDVLALVFAVVNVVLYFMIGNTWLIEHVAVVFYTLLAAQCAASLIRQEPWTMQFTRRVVTPEFAADPRFREMKSVTVARGANHDRPAGCAASAAQPFVSEATVKTHVDVGITPARGQRCGREM